MEEPMYFHLPGAFEKFHIYAFLLPWLKSEPEMMYDNIMIGSVYGSPEKAIWNGGRQSLQEQSKYYKDIKKFFQDGSIPIAFTFTNMLIEERHLSDSFCNFMLKHFDNGYNYVIVNSPILEKYIRETYPGYKIESSTTKCITNEMELIKELDQPYDLITLDYNFNNKFDILEKLPHKEKIKFLCNPVCQPNCLNRKKHYEEISIASIFDDRFWDLAENDCPHQYYDFWQIQKQSFFVSHEDIVNKYYPLGYRHFKIEGRTLANWDLIEALLYYLVKPEYQMRVRETIIKNFYRSQWIRLQE